MVSNGRGKPVPPSRKALAIPIGVVGAFVIAYGLGRHSWQVAALGLALVVLAIGLVFVPALRGGSRIYVSGTGHVVTVSEPPASSVYGRCEMQLVVEAPGLPPAAVRILDSRVPVAKWPDPGATLPILVAVDDLRRVRVQWDDVLTHAEVADYDGQEVLDPDEPDEWERQPETDPAPGASDAVFYSDGEPIIPATHPGDAPPGVQPGLHTAGSVPPPRRPSPYPHNGAAATTTAVLADPRAEPGPADEPADADDVDGAGPVLGVGLTLLVADLERSIAFYRDTLGFHQLDAGDANAVLASRDTRLVLRAVKDVTPVNRRLVHINLEVRDVKAMYEALKGKGVRFTYAPRLVNRGARLELWAAAFKDPDGHGVALAQWHQQPPAAAAEETDEKTAAEGEPERPQAEMPREAPPMPPPPRGPITERLNPEGAPGTAAAEDPRRAGGPEA